MTAGARVIRVQRGDLIEEQQRSTEIGELGIDGTPQSAFERRLDLAREARTTQHHGQLRVQIVGTACGRDAEDNRQRTNRPPADSTRFHYRLLQRVAEERVPAFVDEFDRRRVVGRGERDARDEMHLQLVALTVADQIEMVRRGKAPRKPARRNRDVGVVVVVELVAPAAAVGCRARYEVIALDIGRPIRGYRMFITSTSSPSPGR